MERPSRVVQPERVPTPHPDTEVAASAEQQPGGDTATPWAQLGGLIFVGVVLRLIALNQQLWYDEITTLVESVRRPIGTILTSYTSQNQHTFFSVLAAMSTQTIGEHPWTLRLPAVVFGVLSLPALFFFARLLATQREAMLATGLMTVSYHHVWFSQNARGYTGMLFFTLASSYFFLTGVRSGRWSSWTGYALAIAFGIYTHLSVAFVAASHGLVYLWLLTIRKGAFGRLEAPRWKPIAGFVLAGLLTLLLYIPILPQILARTVGQAGSNLTWEWSNPLWLLQETLRGLAEGAGAAGFPAVLLAGLFASVGLVSLWRRDRYAVGVMLIPALITAGVMMLLEHNLWPRFFFFAIGFAFLFLVRGVFGVCKFAARRLRREPQAAIRFATVLVILMLAGSCWPLRAAYLYPKQDFVGAMQFLDAERRHDEPIVTAGLAVFPYQNYYGRDWRPAETAEELRAVLRESPGTWLVYASPIYLRARHPNLWTIIQEEFTTVRVFRGTLGGGEIYVCRAISRPPPGIPVK